VVGVFIVMLIKSTNIPRRLKRIYEIRVISPNGLVAIENDAFSYLDYKAPPTLYSSDPETQRY
jgi:hypothetical protein